MAPLAGGGNGEATSRDGGQKVLKHLSAMNSGSAWISAANYEEEVQRMKVFYRARHSFIMDALSGIRIDVKSCALPTLTPSHPSTLDELQSRVDFSKRPTVESPMGGHRSQRTTTFMTSMPTAGGATSSVGTSTFRRKPSAMEMSMGGMSFGQTSMATARASQENARGGWGAILSAVEQYEAAVPSCSPNAFLVLGSPGSGKTCLICRLTMDCLDRHRDLVPVLLPVTDLVKRTDEEPVCIEGPAATHAWFDKYLRITFGEHSLRYKMVRQAMTMHRVMFLFEGLEDAGNLSQVVEHLLRLLVRDRHLVFVTSRPLRAGQSSLEGLRELMVTFTLQPLSDEQKRSIARCRLAGGIASYDRFTQRLRQAQGMLTDNGGGEGTDEAMGDRQEDVFGNPMMLSMLICYLQPSKDRAALDDRAAETEEQGVTLTDVYRVAIDVMLQWVQSKQQADRFNKEKKVDMCKRVLEKMAMTMQLQKRLEIEASEFDEKLQLDEELLEAWVSMRLAVEAGHAMFLRASRDGGRLELRFLVRGFQSFFAASEVSNSEGWDLPGLETLLTDPWWAEVLDMLAEAWPHKYVKVIENKLESFRARDGNTFLHLAAQQGHKPVFQLLRLFSESNQAHLHGRNSQKQTPLHVAADRGGTKLCALMIESKAEVDAEDAAERLPMHVAMQQAHFQTAKFLLDRWKDANGGRGSGSVAKQQSRRGGKDNPAEKLAVRILGLGAGTPMTEDEFKVAVEETFVELAYFGRSDEMDRKKSIGAIMAVFWIVANHYDKFVRGQKAEPLTKSSWENIQDWTQRTVQLTSSPAKVGAMLVSVWIHSIGKIKPFKKVFAPDYEEAGEALVSVLQKDPVLIPSFSKLDENLRLMMLSALQVDFNFGQFLQAENLPASLENVKNILGEGESSANILGFFLFRIFATMCGINGFVSLDGSLFMNEPEYTNFKVGLDVLQYLMEESAQEVYDRFLKKRAQKLGFTFEPENKESRARVRLGCLARFQDASKGKEVSEAFNKLSPSERSLLSDYLTADGINQKGFLLYSSPQLMANSAANTNIGLLHAMKMLLRVYQLADQEFKNSDQQVITIYVQPMALYAKSCKDVEVFDFTQFDIKRASGHKSDSQGSVRLSPWQLENSPEKLDSYALEGENLAVDVITKSVREPQFHKRLEAVFPELSYMDGNDVDEVCALLVVFWAATDQLEAFARTHGADEKLSEPSWREIGRWMEPLLLECDAMNVLFVAVMLHAVGKIPKLHTQLAPEVMAHVMSTCPKVLPSFMRLDKKLRHIVQECLTREFEFKQFLHAENLPANLLTVKEMLNCEESRRMLHIFVMCIFAEVSGLLGTESLEGSLYMTEERFKKFRIGTDALRLLSDGSSVYDARGVRLPRQ